MADQLFDEYTEAALLGCLMTFNRALDEVTEILEPRHFGKLHHGAMYAGMLALHRKNSPIDPLILSAEIDAQGNGHIASKAQIFGLDGQVRLANIRAHADRIRDFSILRDLRQMARQLIADVEQEGASGVEMLETVESQLFAMRETATRTDWQSGQEVATRIGPIIEALQESGEAVIGLTSGFDALDKMTRGLHPGDVSLVGARPSMGKTAFGLQIAMHASKRAPVAFFSVEMATDSIGMRAVISEADVNGFRLMSGSQMSEAEVYRVNEGVTSLANSAIYFDDSPRLSPVHVRSKLRRLQAKVGKLGLVVIDYMGLMQSLPEHQRENQTNKIAGISRALKIIAREMAVPFLILSQLNRGPEHQKDKRPAMSDLRDSGALEQDADVVMLLHRDHYYNQEAPADEAEIIVAKQRNGPTGVIRVTWHAPQMKFGAERER
ncbi:MAG TPA: replicative DNA helicase [Actinobacteria bacterium]|nr:replicative DNA helicase [Actinomycetota bacterium]